MIKEVTVQPLPGYKEVKPFVYAGFFPVSNEDYNDLKEAIEKLSLSDSALVRAGEFASSGLWCANRFFGIATYGHYSRAIGA